MSVSAHSTIKTKEKKRGQLVGGDGLGSVGQTVINAKFMAKVSKFMAVNRHIAECLPKYWPNSWVSVCPILGAWVPCPFSVNMHCMQTICGNTKLN